MLRSLFKSKNEKDRSPKKLELPANDGGTSNNNLQLYLENSTLSLDDGTSSSHSGNNQSNPDGSIQEYYLKKRLPDPHKKGLHWREDPTGKDWLRNNRHWPRDYATIRGILVVHEGKRWLHAQEVKQVETDVWQKAPKGAYLPFHFGKLYMLVPLKKYTPKLNKPKRLRGILVNESLVITTTRRRKRMEQFHVSFSSVFLREYARTVGDNPTCSTGPPIAISWEHSETVTVPVDSYEKERSRHRCRHPSDMIVPREERERMLRQDWDVPQANLAQAIREVLKIKNSRRRTVDNQTSTIGKMGDALLEKLARGGNNHKATVLVKQQQQAFAQLQEEQRHQGDQDSYKSRVSSSRSLQRKGSPPPVPTNHQGETSVPVNFEEPLLPNQPVDLEILMNKLDACRCHPGSNWTSALKKQQPQETNSKEEPKSVSFATRSSSDTNQEVWCFVEELERFDQDPDLKALLWWHEEELDVRAEQDQSTATLLQVQYGALLNKAYKSTRALTPDKYQDDQEAVSLVELNPEEMTVCAIARGLEPKVIPQTRDFMIRVHMKSVLEHANQKDENRCWDSIRRSSLQISRPGRLLALKLAAFDQYDAVAP